MDVFEEGEHLPAHAGEDVRIDDAGRSSLITALRSREQQPPQQALVSPLLQDMLDALPEMATLLGEDGRVLATNAAWKSTFSGKAIEGLEVGTSFFEYLRMLDAQGDESAGRGAAGVAAVCEGRRRNFTHLYCGSGIFSGERFHVSATVIGGEEERFVLFTCYDVSELFDLRMQRRRFGSRLLRAQEDERRRIARDLHDSTSQLLVGLQLDLMQLRQHSSDPRSLDVLADCSETLGQVFGEIRSLSYLYHPPAMHADTLALTLEEMVSGFAKRAGLRVRTSLGDIEGMSNTTAATIYRLLQEALANVHRHAYASNLEITLARVGEDVHLTVQDDGVGFELRPADGSQLGVGIRGMEERVRDLGGSLTIRKIDQGTLLTASLPYK